MAESIWGSIRDSDHVHVRLRPDLPADCGGGAVVRRPDGQIWILIDADLPQPERRAVLAHELEHVRRGSMRFDDAPASWDVVIAREERRIDRAVAQRLVPLEELRAFVAQRRSIEVPVTASCVAEAFDVPLRVAQDACEMAASPRPTPPVTG